MPERRSSGVETAEMLYMVTVRYRPADLGADIEVTPLVAHPLFPEFAAAGADA